MNRNLALAADFIDRLTNPAYGAEVNEAHALRWAELQGKEASASGFGIEELDADDVPYLSSTAWLWLLGSLGPGDPEAPPKFLDALFNSVADPVFRLRVGDVVLKHPHLVERYVRQEKAVHLAELPDSWITRRLRHAVRADREDHVDDLIEMVMILLQVGNEPAIVMLRSLIATEDASREMLVGLVRDVVAQGGASESEWLRRLGI